MIKKILGLFILGLCCINFSSADATVISECYPLHSAYASYGTNGKGWCLEITPSTNFTFGNYTNSVSSYFGFQNGLFQFFQQGNSSNSIFTSMFWSGGKLYSFSNRSNGYASLYEVIKFCEYNGTDYAGLINHCFIPSSTSDPVYNNQFYYFSSTLDDIKFTFGGKQADKIVLTNGFSFRTPTISSQYLLCGVYSSLGKSFCVFPRDIDATMNGLSSVFTGYVGYQNQGSSDAVSSLFSASMVNSPLYINNGGGGGGITVNFGSGAIELGSDESAINYYEKTYGWDEKICYVGVDNYTDLYGTRVSFQEGSGLSIFEVFSGLYGNTDLDKVYVWLNSWLINYDEFWVKQSLGLEPTRKAIYNSGTNQVDLIYTGLDVSPFINSPVAVYFMSNYIYDRSPYKTMGSQVVSYCNIKINSGTFDEIIDQSDKNNITDYTEQSNKNIGLNPDGTVDTIDYSQFGYGGGQAFGVSGVELAFSGNTSIKNTLKNFFDEFDNALSSLDITTNTRILPTWLVTAFLFVVLFKFLRKRS